MTTRDFAAGDVVDGKYRLARQLGEGGIGTVWIGWQELVQRDVAVKFLKGELEAEQRQRFLLEARALGRLNHPNCITIYDFGYSEPHAALFLVMEYLDGEALSEFRGRSVPTPDVIEIAKQIANALAYAHHQGVFHRDLKPENVMLVPTFTGETLVKVLDFGLARLGTYTDDNRLTKTGEIFGTPAYMSPEQIRGTRNAGPPSDIYSLGIMMYEMLERRLPFENMASFDLMMAHVTKPIPPFRRQVRPDLAAVVLKCLQKNPTDRYASALDLWKALSSLGGTLDEDSSMAFAEVDAPDRTFEGTPPTPFVPSDFESTLDDDSETQQTKLPAPVQLPAAAQDIASPNMETVLLSTPQPTLTAVSSPGAPSSFDWKYALTVTGVGLAIVVFATVFLIVYPGSTKPSEDSGAEDLPTAIAPAEPRQPPLPPREDPAPSVVLPGQGPEHPAEDEPEESGTPADATPVAASKSDPSTKSEKGDKSDNGRKNIKSDKGGKTKATGDKKPDKPRFDALPLDPERKR